MLLASLLALGLSGIFLWLIRPHDKRFAGWLAAVPPGLITAWLLSRIDGLAEGVYSEYYGWIPSLGLDLSLRLDGLALLFGLIITGIGAGVALYTHSYFEDEPRQGYFYLALFAFMASMLGLVWADNLLTLFVFWEGTSITSYLLIGFNHESARARAGARNALIITGAGGLAMLAGLVLLGQEAGTYTISEMVAGADLTGSATYPAALILILLGAFTKSAQFPFHFWLPGAMSAPTPASAYLHSATMVKAGIYLIARLHPALGDTPLWFWSLLVAGGITMLLGAVFALHNWDIKGLLAYATVSQLGILTVLLAFPGEAALIAAVVGILAHALYKGPLFLVAGIVDHATGTRDLRRLAGLWRQMPWTTSTAVLAGISMAGMPPFFGFLAKETLLDTFYHFPEGENPLVGWIGYGAVVVAGAFFVAYSLTLLWEAFFRRQSAAPEQAHVHHRPAFSFVLAPLLLAAIGTVAPFMLTYLALLIDPAISAIANETIETHLALWHGFTPVFISSLVAIAIGLGLFAGRNSVRRTLDLLPERLRAVMIFQAVLEGLYRLGGWTARVSQGYTLSTQSAIVIIAALIPLLAALTYTDLSVLAPDWSQTIEIPEIVLAAMLVVAAIITVRTSSRLGAIVSLGIVGITVTLFYVFYSAPDLALTQLLIEVLTLVLLVLVFHKLPPDTRPPMRGRRQIRVLLVAFAAGLLGAGLVLFNSSPSLQVAESISAFFLQASVPEGHGGNVVNVILVDFRGFDTMGEITVLALAALGGYALLRAPRVFLPPANGVGLPTNADEHRADGNHTGEAKHAAQADHKSTVAEKTG
jgi:multicomponent Na+:H+ antiporter subunit A